MYRPTSKPIWKCNINTKLWEVSNCIYTARPSTHRLPSRRNPLSAKRFCWQQRVVLTILYLCRHAWLQTTGVSQSTLWHVFRVSHSVHLLRIFCDSSGHWPVGFTVPETTNFAICCSQFDHVSQMALRPRWHSFDVPRVMYELTKRSFSMPSLYKC